MWISKYLKSRLKEFFGEDIISNMERSVSVLCLITISNAKKIVNGQWYRQINTPMNTMKR